MKTLSFEISKRLNNLGLLDNIETEYCYYKGMLFDYNELSSYTDNYTSHNEKEIKTLTLEELGEFLRNINFGYGIGLTTYFNSIQGLWESCYTDEDFERDESLGIGRTQFESMENLLKYLLDNNLFPKE